MTKYKSYSEIYFRIYSSRLKLKDSVIYSKIYLGDLLCASVLRTGEHSEKLYVDILDNEIIIKCIIIGLINYSCNKYYKEKLNVQWKHETDTNSNFGHWRKIMFMLMLKKG